MTKYEKMLETNRSASRDKIERAKNEIALMLKGDTKSVHCVKNIQTCREMCI